MASSIDQLLDELLNLVDRYRSGELAVKPLHRRTPKLSPCPKCGTPVLWTVSHKGTKLCVHRGAGTYTLDSDGTAVFTFEGPWAYHFNADHSCNPPTEEELLDDDWEVDSDE